MGIFRLPAPSAELGVLYPLFAIAFMVEVGLGIVSPILPAIMHEFSLSASQIALMVTLFGLARLLTDLLLGFILDQADRTKVLVMGTLLIVVGSTGCAIAPNYSLVLFARAVMGAGSAVCLVTLLVIISKASHEEAKGSAIGVFQASLLAGVAMGPAVGGVSASLAGWRTAFIVCAVAAGLTTLLVLVAARRGTLKLTTAPRLQDGRRETNVSERHERHDEGPRWDLTAINFTTFVFFVSVSGFRNSMIPIYGGTEIGLSIAALGLMLAGSGVIRFFVTLQSGFASDRYGRKIILVPGIGFLVAGTLGFVLARDSLGFAFSLLILSLGGFGNSLPTTMIVDSVSPGQLGRSISLNRFIGDLGMMLGPVALGWVLDVSGFTLVALVTATMLVATLPGIVLTVHEKPRAQWSPQR